MTSTLLRSTDEQPDGDDEQASLPRLMWKVTEVAEMLGIKVTTVRGLIHRNEIKWQKPGRDYLIPDAELKRYATAGNETTSAPGRVSA